MPLTKIFSKKKNEEMLRMQERQERADYNR